jgi:putative thioredoxin
MSDTNGFSGGNAYNATVSYGAAGQAAAPPVKDTTTAGFTADVIQESRRQPVLVDFWAPWCGPCKQLQPALEKVVAAAAGKVRLVKMNIDEHPAIAGQLGIQSIPAVIAFKDGKPVDGFMGAVPESQIREFVQRVIGKNGGAEVEEALAAAREAREAGDPAQAAELFQTVLDEMPEHVEALAGLADLLYESGDAENAEAVLDRVPQDKRDTPAVAAVRSRMALAAEAAGLGDPAALQRRLAENPKDHQARFDLAMIQNAQGKRAEAADNLLAIVKADRSWNDDGARAQLLKLFEAWGLTDEATLSARRKLSSLLFS